MNDNLGVHVEKDIFENIDYTQVSKNENSSKTIIISYLF